MSSTRSTKNHTGGAEKARSSGKTRRTFVIIGGLVICVAAAGLWAIPQRGGNEMGGLPVPVERADLPITVVTEGAIESIESQEVKSQVEGTTAILRIVEEGTKITEQDVRNGKILVELDSSRLRDSAAQQEIKVANSNASLVQAQESFNIQEKENESNIAQARLGVKFAWMDLERYLGAELAKKIVSAEIDFLQIAESADLAGAARQERDRYDTDISLKDEEATLAQNDLKWTEDLVAKGYETQDKLEAERLKVKRYGIEGKQARMAQKLFLKYEFAKEAESLYADWEESKRELDRVESAATAELAQANANLKSRQATHRLENSSLKKINRQIENCVIKATQVGLVIYASTSGGWGRSQQLIEEGATVRERQTIIEVPNTSSMACNIKVHEAVIKKVKRGQKVTISIEAYPDRPLVGRITRVAPLPDSQSRWMNPDLKVYSTLVAIDGAQPHLKPSMTAKAEIHIENLENVLQVAVQAVHTFQGQSFCAVRTESGPELRTVVLGQTNDKKVHIKEGLIDSDQVYLNVSPTMLASAAKMASEANEAVASAAVSPEGSTGADSSKKSESDSGQSKDSAGSDQKAAESVQSDQTKSSGNREGGGEARQGRGGEGGQGGRPDWANMTDEQRQRMRGQQGGEGRQGREGRGTEGRESRGAEGRQGRGGEGRQGRGGWGNMSSEERQKRMQERMQNMSEEDRKQMQERMQRFQNMSDEERQKMREQWGGGRGGQGQ
jgi:HlyD family secretion protein